MSGTGRTASPDGRVAPPSSSRWRRSTIVGTLAVIVVLGMLVWGRTASDRPPESGPQAIWGRRWQLVRLDVGDAVIDTGLTGRGGGAIILDARRSGEMSVRVCNDTGGSASVVEGRIEVGRWYTTAVACGDPLDDLVRLDGASIDATSKRLVLSAPGEDGGPSIRSTWVPPSSLAPDDAVRGRVWSVTEVRGSDGERRTMGHRIAPVVSLLEPDRIEVVGCGTHSKAGRVEAGRIELDAGPWTEHVAECESAKARTYTPMIMKILDSGATARRDGYRLWVRGKDGSSFAAASGVGSSVWDLFEDPHEPSTARWLIVDARDREVRRQVVGAPVLTAAVNAGGPRYTVSVSGCGRVEAEVVELQGSPGSSTLEPTAARGSDPTGPHEDCTNAEADQATWMNELFASKPELDVAHNRARLRASSRWMVLVRLD